MSKTAPTHTEFDGEDITVLMTGAGAPGASGIIRSLRANGERNVRIVGVDMNPEAYGFSLVDEHYTVPGGREEGYIDRMVELARQVDADVVLPLTTAELGPLSRHKDDFDAAVMISDAHPLEVANDKGHLYAFLEEGGYASAPRFRRVKTIEEFVDAVEAFGYPENPVCFKRPVASGMRGFRVLDGRSDRLHQLLWEKPNSAVTTLEDIRPILAAADPFPELVVMEHLPGEEYSVDVLAMGDTVGPVVPRSRSRTRAGISFEGTVEHREDLIAESEAICTGLGVEYNVNIQFKYDAAGVPKLIEINPRVAGTIIMCVGAGANLPYLGVKYALGEEIPPVDIEWGTHMVRYWQEVFRAPDGRTFHVDPEGEGQWSPAR